MPSDGFGGGTERTIGDRSVSPDHPLGLPAAQSHQNRHTESRIERHRGAMMSEVMEVKVLESGGAGRLPKHVTDMDSAIRMTVWPREHPRALMGLQDLLE